MVRLPRTGIEPLDILGRSGNQVVDLGSIKTVWDSKKVLPNNPIENTAANISGKRTSRLDVSLGLSILDDIFNGMGVSFPKIKEAYQKASFIEFMFNDVSAPQYEPLEVGEYLAKGYLSTDNPVVKHYLLDDKNQAYLITEVLKSNEITVLAYDEHGNEIDTDIDLIKSGVGGSVSVKNGNTKTSSIAYTGNTKLTFGFKYFK